ncbi:MAG TPA: endonuclease domain-containing protein [Rubrivivax sp.]|nr:endonuclease domain-containing protein [Rubrivivax sp.]
MSAAAQPTDSLSRARERARVRARELRPSSTEAERLIWQRLRNRQLSGCKFRRQHPAGPFFADFACIEAGLIVELDGGQHVEPEAAERDERRTAVLGKLGFSVLRFDDRQALAETEAVLSAILQWLDAHHPHPDPLPPAGEGVHSRNTP